MMREKAQTGSVGPAYGAGGSKSREDIRSWVRPQCPPQGIVSSASKAALERGWVCQGHQGTSGAGTVAVLGLAEVLRAPWVDQGPPATTVGQGLGSLPQPHAPEEVQGGVRLLSYLRPPPHHTPNPICVSSKLLLRLLLH